ncbi:OLC1v1034117C1 [Oldenlandia corymbosa var. corymbosa]|uniref:OLC1v1034117C1 n=1 Tax=Oldenlandia corymbosa var. corymbosa TaxID=529605 RepID=A0AAV1CR67_OLDCO|nr:OLC1v1034117C1 [Oldenlandia corymbosa var. corymbosa]
MSRRNGSAPKLDLKLNLSPPRGNLRVQSPSRSSTVSPTSPPSSCLSSELNQEDNYVFSNSPDSTAMIVAGCPRCLMYIMLPEKDPRCPKCKSTVLLEVFGENNKNGGGDSTAASTTTTTRKQRK